jgi:uncharacterized protein with PIN domain
VTLYAETSAILRWLFVEEGGEAIRSALAAAEKVTPSRLALIETRRVARRAEGSFPNEPVGTLDAIHLASALFLRQSFPDLVALTSDDRVRANATLLGFPAEVARA